MTKKINQLIDQLAASQPQDTAEVSALKRRLCGQLKLALPTNTELLNAIKQRPDGESLSWLVKLLKKRAVRTLSGVAPVAVLTKPDGCPGNCAYCPNEPGVPRSYLSNEPAVMRAQHCNWRPAEQVNYRLKALKANGHEPNKIELIVIGGTWSAYTLRYQYWYIASCFWAANDFGRANRRPQLKASDSLEALKAWLKQEQQHNEKAAYRIIGITLETRPDHINKEELWRMRELGATRIELGVQAIDDQILKLNNRQSTVADIVEATTLAKNFGFKVTYHFMPALPGSSPDKDVAMYSDMFSQAPQVGEWSSVSDFNHQTLKTITEAQFLNNDFNPDQIKFYPTVVTKGSLLYRWWQQGQYHPYTDQELTDVILRCKKNTPPFVRIIRLIRDIPGDSIEAGNKITNLRQVLQNQGASCRCIRCREAGQHAVKGDLKLVIRKFQANQATEYFLAFEDEADRLFGFLRLRLADNNPLQPQKKLGFIREVHVYGQLVPVGGQAKIQHRGLGKRLIATAEALAKASGFEDLAVIAGVGVRDYYRQQGYRLKQSYLVKKI